MRKIIAILMVLGLVVSLCSCNMGMGVGNFSYSKVHIDTHNGSGCVEIKKWYDNDSGIEVTTKEKGSLFLSEGTYILVSGNCPICDSGKGGEK